MTPSSQTARQYARAHVDKFQGELFEMLRIPSLSGDPAHADDVRRMAEWLAAHLRSLGVENVAVLPTNGYPIVYGEYLYNHQIYSGKLTGNNINFGISLGL